MANPTIITDFQRKPNTVFVSVQPPVSAQHVQQYEVDTEPTASDGKNRKAVFAALGELEPRFDKVGITDADYWDMIKTEFSIVSRTELSDAMWARLSATLNACRRDPDLLNKLVAKVKAHTAIVQIPVTDASPFVFAEPEDTVNSCFVIRRDRTDGTETVIFVGAFSDAVKERCQTHADTSRCIVQLYHAGNDPEPYYPSREGGRSPV